MVSFQDKIEQYLTEIRELEKTFREAQGKEVLPLSFFSTSYDVINRLKTGIYEIEAAQFNIMQEHLKKIENEGSEMREEPKIIADTIGRKINVDFGKSLSLNDRFMFQRDLFQGNADKMNHAFMQLNTSLSLDEVLKLLNEQYDIAWNSDSGAAFKELLDKKFT